MKKNNILKLSAFLMAAVCVLSSSAYTPDAFSYRRKPSLKVNEPEISLLDNAASSDQGTILCQQLENAYDNADTCKITEICNEITADICAVQNEIADIGRLVDEWNISDITERQEKYENEISIRAAETLDAIEKLRNGKATDESLDIIRSYFEIDEEYYRSDATPNISAASDDLSIVKASSSDENADIVSPPPSDSDLVSDLNNDQLGTIKAIAEKFDDVKSIYLFIKNNITTEFYSGSKKGAAITLDQLGGNDIDQAALLIELLRTKNIPARFVEGTISLTAEQAIALTGADNAKTAGRVLNSPNLNVQGVSDGNDIIAYRMKHTWVEAYIPYTDYRGAGNNSGESMWIQLDPSFKTVDNICENVESDFSSNDKKTFEDISAAREQFPDFISDSYTQPETFSYHYSKINICSDEYLPSSLPYTVIEAGERYSHLRDADRDKLTISIGGETLVDSYLSELYYFSPVVTFQPATDYDREVMEKYEKITDVPAYLVNVVPVVTVGNTRYTGSSEASLGSLQQMITTIKNSSGTTVLDDSLICGSVYAFNFDIQKQSVGAAEAAEKRIDFAKEKFSNETVCSDYVLGSFADYAGKYYFTLCDTSAHMQSGLNNINMTRNLGLCITGYKFGRTSSFGTINSLKDGTFYIDVAYNSIKAVSLDGNKETEKKYLYSIGSVESFYEGYIWEQLFNGKSSGISTIKIFEAASELGISNRFICSKNLESELALCNISESVKNEVRNFVNQGLYVEIVPETVSIGDWTGTGYIALNRDNGSASFMISGGTAGGTLSNVESMFELNLTLAKINELLAIGTLVKDLCSQDEYFGHARAGLSFAFSLGAAYNMRYDTLYYIFDYAADAENFSTEFTSFTIENLGNTIANLSAFISSFAGGKVKLIGEAFQTLYYNLTTAYHLADGIDNDNFNISSSFWNNINTSIDIIISAFA